MKHLVAFSCVESFSAAIVSAASVHVREKETERSRGLVRFCSSSRLVAATVRFSLKT